MLQLPCSASDIGYSSSVAQPSHQRVQGIQAGILFVPVLNDFYLRPEKKKKRSNLCVRMKTEEAHAWFIQLVVEVIVVRTQDNCCTAPDLSRDLHGLGGLWPFFWFPFDSISHRSVREVAATGHSTRGSSLPASDPVAPIEIGIRFQLVGGDDYRRPGEKCLVLPLRVGCAEFDCDRR